MKITKLFKKRRNYLKNYMHNLSRRLINYAKLNEYDKIVIINNKKEIKSNISESLPISRLIRMLKYKAEDVNIEVELYV